MNLYNMIVGGTYLNSISVDILNCLQTNRDCKIFSLFFKLFFFMLVVSLSVIVVMMLDMKCL
jgi:hypothetical protein